MNTEKTKSRSFLRLILGTTITACAISLATFVIVAAPLFQPVPEAESEPENQLTPSYGSQCNYCGAILYAPEYEHFEQFADSDSNHASASYSTNAIVGQEVHLIAGEPVAINTSQTTSALAERLITEE